MANAAQGPAWWFYEVVSRWLRQEIATWLTQVLCIRTPYRRWAGQVAMMESACLGRVCHEDGHSGSGKRAAPAKTPRWQIKFDPQMDGQLTCDIKSLVSGWIRLVVSSGSCTATVGHG